MTIFILLRNAYNDVNKNVLGICLLLVAFFVTIIIIYVNCCSYGHSCEIPLKDVRNPLVFLSSSDNKLLYPSSEHTILVNFGETVVFGCPGSILNIGIVSVEATCVSNSVFLISNAKYDVDTLSCNGNITSTARYTNRSCELDGKEIEIGFNLGGDYFIRQIQICFDKENQTTMYAHHNLSKSIGNAMGSFPNVNFNESNFYDLGNKSLDYWYGRDTQRKTINKQVGLSAESTKFINPKTNSLLTRGHLSPKGDFVYPSQKEATFYYVNVVPQWKLFNNENWNNLELAVRRYVQNNNVNLQVYTGTFGICSLPSVNNTNIPIFLYDEKMKKAVPVPQLFWKVIYDPSSKGGVALLGLNNPYTEDIEGNVICDDVFPKLSWAQFNKSNIVKGYIYACEVDQLRRSVKQLPSFKVAQLLV